MFANTTYGESDSHKVRVLACSDESSSEEILELLSILPYNFLRKPVKSPTSNLSDNNKDA